ncbi:MULTISPECIES: ATP-binding protein [Mesorhizobium]|jgi:two-component system, OmpR family, osmolarity sensor histidine kinase EnvZ|uniref:ATP-binding protein n=7 Tax=Phyllobacteriaceae TaxID=69277 RepID=UPI000FCA444E|nr:MULTISPECIES: ATP-binding protein [Mesorhizobium]RUU08265.1 two-component sensor histidine kinase [Mesorhizobium sp. M7A.T.Ca.TU.009.01.3.2]RUV07589.1 two-component sensor histidine kinase [Mesorhizobium sp. M7A.T.Ca.TU.009.01.3.1]RUV53230.1 two-component sensor histidine kinase [Mesorhizobium sp. M7A.F.Ca.MR.228.00.0.0]RVB39314.1 two-component sensor histidine kinase [Mesorhizobium sp. M7A.F.Ca.CA.004.05.1.1]AZV20540.1 two-component sensor histidine kinase [Mesorhizobium sp. M7A.F.Ce.TU.01
MATTELEQPGNGGLSVRAARTLKAVPRAWNRFWRLVSLYMPKRLYARSLIIVIAPMILLQSVVAFVFMERHWATVTQRLSQATVRDIAAIIDLIETYPRDADYTNIIRIAQDRMQLKVDLLPPDPLPAPGPKPFFSILDDVLSSEITRQINRPFWIDTVGNSNIVEVRVQLEGKVLRVFVRRSQAYASNTHIFLIWMVGTSLVLLMIAIPFLRNQIRPILMLAEAAESFGKGRPMPRDFRPRGAEEVRRAGFAFMQMRERIERQIEQRTAMLTGVSHDLRTILTRFKLQLALSGGKAETKAALDQDIDDMQSMLEGYLAFARGEASEDAGRFDLEAYFEKLGEEARLRKRKLSTTLAGDPDVHVRPNAFARLMSNVIGNAFRYAKTVEVNATHGRGSLLVTIDDDGPGIPADRREDVFKPFVRLDEARNLDASGTGLGLSIARDIARSHGGDITLEDSPLGGLRAIIKVPA